MPVRQVPAASGGLQAQTARLLHGPCLERAPCSRFWEHHLQQAGNLSAKSFQRQDDKQQERDACFSSTLEKVLYLGCAAVIICKMLSKGVKNVAIVDVYNVVLDMSTDTKATPASKNCFVSDKSRKRDADTELTRRSTQVQGQRCLPRQEVAPY